MNIKLNHNQLPANLAHFIADTSPLCPLHFENPQPATLTHILFVCLHFNQEKNKLEQKLQQLKAPRPWSHISILHSPILKKISQALYTFFGSIRDKLSV